MKFLEKIVANLLEHNSDLSGYHIVLPGKRPVVFFRKLLSEKGYSGFMPQFSSIEELIREIAGSEPVQGVFLWLTAYDVYSRLPVFPKDDFSGFLKWFPTILKDWDDMLKFAASDAEVLQFMLDEERIKAWAQNLGAEDADKPRAKFLNFWQNMKVFLPALKAELQAANLATGGMLHRIAAENLDTFIAQSTEQFVFCGFNAFTPFEEKLVKSMLQTERGQCFFQADSYYVYDERQEAGKFLREHRKWAKFNESRKFNWIEDDFQQPKNIQIYEVSGNISQSKLLPEILDSIGDSTENDLDNTAVILLDENLLPATLDSLSGIKNLNITMGFPLKNLSFSNAVKHIFHLQKQLEKKSSSYYYADLLSILEQLPSQNKDQQILTGFKSVIEKRNIIYISKKLFEELLGNLSYRTLLEKPDSLTQFLTDFAQFCNDLKFRTEDDILFENISHFEQTFNMLHNYLDRFSFHVSMETLELLFSQMISSENIDFEGEPLQGLQVMGLLETRLLNFKNIILLSVNEGKLPLGNTQNTYIPFDVRREQNMHTFLENDSIYAYHFYRLLQDAENVHLLYNALSSGVNTGEKSRFITQLEFEDKFHDIKHTVIENASEPAVPELVSFEKSPAVVEKLQLWKERVSASHLISYLYNPVDFYLSKILGTREAAEIEEELSVRNYGNLVHYALQHIYEDRKSRFLTVEDLTLTDEEVQASMEWAVQTLKHQMEFYEKGINYIHFAIAERVVRSIVDYDRELVQKGNKLRILDLERKFEDIALQIDENAGDVKLYGFIDRIDELNGVVRIIDYKTAKTKNLTIKVEEENKDSYLNNYNQKQALQLCLYQYVVNQLPEFAGKNISTGIWSFAEVKRGVATLEFEKGTHDDAMVSVKNLILEILNPEIAFVEPKKVEY